MGVPSSGPRGRRSSEGRHRQLPDDAREAASLHRRDPPVNRAIGRPSIRRWRTASCRCTRSGGGARNVNWNLRRSRSSARRPATAAADAVRDRSRQPPAEHYEPDDLALIVERWRRPRRQHEPSGTRRSPPIEGNARWPTGLKRGVTSRGARRGHRHRRDSGRALTRLEVDEAGLEPRPRDLERSHRSSPGAGRAIDARGGVGRGGRHDRGRLRDLLLQQGLMKRLARPRDHRTRVPHLGLPVPDGLVSIL